MEQRQKTAFTIVAIIAGIILLALGYAAAGLVGAAAAGAFVFLVFLAVSYFRTNYLILNEMEVGVVFDRFDNFVCFLDNDYGRIYPRAAGSEPYNDDTMPPKRLKPIRQHHISPAIEVVKTRLRKGSFDAKGVSKDVRTKEGIQVTIPWSVSFRVEVLRIQPGIEHKMARVLPAYADKLVTGRVLQIIQHIVGQKRIEELYATGDNDGAIQKLEDELRTELLTRAKAVGITGIAAHDVKLGPLVLPPQIESTLRVSHQRQLHTDTLAKSLKTLREAIAAFTPEDMERLTELERLRIIDEKTKSLTLTESFARKENNIRIREEDVGPANGNALEDAQHQ